MSEEVLTELLAREYHAGTKVTNCVPHMMLPLTERREGCTGCFYDMKNLISHAVSVNEWLNKWKDDASALLKKMGEGK